MEILFYSYGLVPDHHQDFQSGIGIVKTSKYGQFTWEKNEAILSHVVRVGINRRESRAVEEIEILQCIFIVCYKAHSFHCYDNVDLIRPIL